ncbi:hypothetical protein TTHERM_00853180 (macronuclear) [Tetrahymena thermophila SB210]|uniref:Uncharacterized protein n=1 Tax=Tetrahymena thermophila (strain SB210) TaxID=312017 RepID=Q24E22_TETTS|nr:hypothetical protein TTHERM_00853180 [Tetrahymena thermophila SB210]EAS06079.2 hypothetical protein TTHERM_00853180 [Tetrahymena thermophila SB210]|eukprot:XP_001026324.2 hypothetical protein TTHERM_00853180 [Tetrahymena thermophila SB210]
MKKSNPASKVTSPQGQQKQGSQSWMTESQVKTIVQNCNSQLKQIETQTDALRQQLAQQDKSIQTITQNITKINLDYENTKVDAAHAESLYNILKKYNEEINLIQQAYYFEGNNQTLQCPKLNSIDFMIKEIEKSKTTENNKKQILNFLNKLRQKTIDNLISEAKMQQIEKVYSKYTQEFEIMKKVLSTTTFCTNCKELFLPEQNHETACFYHPGKLKYFSCRTCGADDYYTCCLKCSRCCIGCANSAHIA